MTAAISTPNLALQRQVLSIRERVAGLVINTPEDYSGAGEMLRSIVELGKQIDATFDPIIADANRAHKTAIETKKRFSGPVIADREALDRKMLSWSREQERIRRQKEQELAAQVRRDQEAQALREAEELERQGEPELADVVLENQIAAPAPVVSIASAVPKVEGLGKRTAWQFRIKDAALVPREYCEPAMTKIGGVVRALKGATRIAGVEVFEVDIPVHR